MNLAAKIALLVMGWFLAQVSGVGSQGTERGDKPLAALIGLVAAALIAIGAFL